MIMRAEFGGKCRPRKDVIPTAEGLAWQSNVVTRYP